MNKKLLLSLMAAFVVFLFGASDVAACSCMRMSSCEAYARAEIVFTGKIIKASDAQGSRKHQVQVEENFLGMENMPLVDVFTDNASSCMFAMEADKDYLIFAWRNEETGALWTGMCSHTAQIEDAKEDLEYLRSVKTSETRGGTIKGIVTDAERPFDDPKKPEGIDKVFIEKANGQKFETSIAPDGNYELNGLDAGKYQIFVKPPKGYITGEAADTYADDEDINPKFIEVAGRGCAVKSFDVKINGVISGKILDANGLPVRERNVALRRLADSNKVKTEDRIIPPPPVEPGAEVETEEPDEKMTSEAAERIDEPEAREFDADFDAYTDENGFYSFKGLPPGRYLLGVGIDNYFDAGSEDDQYVPTYFPSSKKRETAVIIELKKAEILTEKNIQLYPKLKKRKIAGQVVWKNNRAESKAQASFYAKREGISGADWGGNLTVDAKGNFSFDGYEETEYLIKVWFAKPANQNSSEITHSAKCLIVPKNGAVKPFKLTLETGGSNCDEEPFRDR